MAEEDLIFLLEIVTYIRAINVNYAWYITDRLPMLGSALTWSAHKTVSLGKVALCGPSVLSFAEWNKVFKKFSTYIDFPNSNNIYKVCWILADKRLPTQCSTFLVLTCNIILEESLWPDYESLRKLLEKFWWPFLKEEFMETIYCRTI